MIRPAVPNQNDISQLMALCKMANASAPNYQLKINKRKVQQTLLAAMDDRKSFLYVAEPPITHILLLKTTAPCP